MEDKERDSQPKNVMTPEEREKTLQLFEKLDNRPVSFRDITFSHRSHNLQQEPTLLNQNSHLNGYVASELNQRKSSGLLHYDNTVSNLPKIFVLTAGAATYHAYHKIWTPYDPKVHGKQTFRNWYWPRIKPILNISSLVTFGVGCIVFPVLSSVYYDHVRQTGTTYSSPLESSLAGYEAIALENKEARQMQEEIGLSRKKKLTSEDYDRLMFGLSTGKIKPGHALNRDKYVENSENKDAISLWEGQNSKPKN